MSVNLLLSACYPDCKLDRQNLDTTTGAIGAKNTEYADSYFFRGSAISHDGKFAYAITVWQIIVFSIDQDSGALTFVSKLDYPGESDLIYIGIEDLDRFVYVISSSYGRIYKYTRDTTTGILTPIGSVISMGAGVEPKYITFDGLGRWMYVSCNSTTIAQISQYSINQTTGELTSIASPLSLFWKPWGISTDHQGKYLWITQNNSSGLALCTINPSTGALTNTGTVYSTAAAPRDLVVNPEGTVLILASNPAFPSDKIASYTINTTTGALTYVNGLSNASWNFYSIALDRYTRFVYAANYAVSEILKFDLSATYELAVAGSAVPTDLGPLHISAYFYPTTKIESISPDIIKIDGGYQINITGNFDPGHQYYAFIGPTGTTADYQCWSGKAGQGKVLYPIAGSLLKCFSPRLPAGGPYHIYVKKVTETGESLLESCITAVLPDYDSATFGIRSLYPREMETGPKGIENVNLAYDPNGLLEAVGVLDGVLTAIGRADSDLGGYRITRLPAEVASGSTTITVEYCANWETTGKIAIDGCVYTYTSHTNDTFSGITHLYHGTVVSGTRKIHKQYAPVVDLGNPFNAVQRLRRAILVDYAEGDNLDALGKAVGVPRYDFVANDTLYRNLIKAIAYSPRGTIYGMELALDALLGAGNYTISEDLINEPCVVRVTIDLLSLLSTYSTGKAYLNPHEYTVETSPGVIPLLVNPPTGGSGESVRWNGFNFRSVLYPSLKPSDITITDYDEDPGTTPWVYQGSDESTSVIAGTNYVTMHNSSLDGTPVYYKLNLRSDNYGKNINWSTSCQFNTQTPVGLTDKQHLFGMDLHDGRKAVGWQVDIVSSSFYIYISDGNGTTLSSGVGVTAGQWYTAELNKKGDEIQLLLDGKKVLTYSYTSLAAGSVENPYIAFGGMQTLP